MTSFGAQIPWFTRMEARSMSHTGPLHSPVPGRTDHLAINVRPNSYVIPADVVSGIGEGNSSAGHQMLSALFHSGPRGMSLKRGRFAAGGQVEDQSAVPIMAAGGEHIISPEQVATVGKGDIHHGHRILDAFVKHVRAKTIKTLKKLPGPARR